MVLREHPIAAILGCLLFVASCDGGVGSSLMIELSVSVAVFPWNGTRPVTIS